MTKNKQLYEVTIVKTESKSATVKVLADSADQANEDVYSNREYINFSGECNFPDYEVVDVQESDEVVLQESKENE